MKAKFYALLLLALLSGCTATVQEPELLRQATLAALEEPTLWPVTTRGVDATLRPDNSAYGGHNMILNAVYRTSGPEQVKFAVFLPQGSKLGQCSRNGQDVTCANLSFPGASALVQSSFAALDEILRLAPAETDNYELRQGDRNACISDEMLVLRRTRHSPGGKSHVVTSLDGRPLAAYKQSTFSENEALPPRIASWKAVFNPEQTAYRFVPRGNLAVDVSITRFITE